MWRVPWEYTLEQIIFNCSLCLLVSYCKWSSLSLILLQTRRLPSICSAPFKCTYYWSHRTPTLRILFRSLSALPSFPMPCTKAVWTGLSPVVLHPGIAPGITDAMQRKPGGNISKFYSLSLSSSSPLCHPAIHWGQGSLSVRGVDILREWVSTALLGLLSE